MINFDILRQLVSDPELRGQVTRILTNKVRTEVKGFETSALLSRHLLEAASRTQRGESQANGTELRSLIKEHLNFYEILINQTMDFNLRLAEKLNRLSSPGRASQAPDHLQLSGAVNSTARVAFRIENSRREPIEATFEITPFCNENGSEFVAPEIAFDPPALALKPGQEAKVQLLVVISDTFKPHNTYLATLSVKGLEGTQLLIRLHVQEPVQARSPAPASAAASGAAEAGPASGTSKAADEELPRRSGARRVKPKRAGGRTRSSKSRGKK